MTDTGGNPSVSPGPDDARVTQRLGELPRTVAMPRDVSIRIAAAIEAEAQSARERGSIEVPDETSRKAAADIEPRGWFRRRAPQVLVGAAGVTAVVLGLYVVGSGSGPDSADDSVAGADSAESADQESGSGADDNDAAEESAPDAPISALDEPGPEEGNAPLGSDGAAEAYQSSLVTIIAETGSQIEAGCGNAFADTIGATLVGSAAIDDGVLVVTSVEGTATAEGWTLTSCDAAEAVPDVDPVVVPLPSP